MKKKTGEKAETEAKLDQNRRKINKNIKKPLVKPLEKKKMFSLDWIRTADPSNEMPP